MNNRKRLRLSLTALGVARWHEIPRLAAFIGISAFAILLGSNSRRKWRFSLKGYPVALRISGRSGFYFLMELIAGDAYRAFRPMLSRQREGDAIVMDCGANVGFFGLWALRQNPELKVYCFEPHPETYRDLLEHVRLSKASNRIIAENMAVGSQEGVLDIEVRQDSNMAIVGEVVTKANDVQGIMVKVPVTTIDAYCATHHLRPSLLKVDVEGYELDVLSGAAQTLVHISAVILEAHSPELLKDCTERLRQHGFRVTEVDGLLLADRE